MTRFLVLARLRQIRWYELILPIALMALLLGACGDLSRIAPCTNIGSGCPTPSAEPEPEKDTEQ